MFLLPFCRWTHGGSRVRFGDVFRFIAFDLVLHRVLRNEKISEASYQLMDIERNLSAYLNPVSLELTRHCFVVFTNSG